jgi:hypothetical protein
LWCSQTGDYPPQEDLTNFGYGPYMKVLKTLKSSFIFLATLVEPVLAIRRFLKINK